MTKFGELKSIGHNIADSLASGIGLMIGMYEINVFEDAGRSLNGRIVVDFLRGSVVSGYSSAALTEAVERYREALPELCIKHCVDISEFKTLEAWYGTDKVHRRHFTVTVENQHGKKSVDTYFGSPGQKPKILR